ncbi:leucine rich repeat protein [Blastomyces dermatitidis ER-3]|uniref:Leucine rich repeat protein n=1 Tax=Ajellomyces dermatitidis (strain ER-3 / ATCC MYA-2586) TaxID=559297 RepID=A0ABP2EQA5_AJEDR|nr:leucine rich repeat protein [Blastomyces dermatitidis ER-3]EEQ85781.1 leucine rich repeat protein [Blastomyces dermatitidis ER-3]
MDSDIPLPPPCRARQQTALSRYPPHHRSDYFTFDCSLPSSDPPLFSSDDFQSSALENYHNGSDQLHQQHQQHQQQQQEEEEEEEWNAATRPGSSGSRAQTQTTRKRQYRGTWWGEEEAEMKNKIMLKKGDRYATAGKKRRTEFKDKRNIDSGVWFGSDDSVESAVSNNSELEGNDCNGRVVPGPYYATGVAGGAGAGAGTDGRSEYLETTEEQTAILRGPIFARSRQAVDRANATKAMQVDEPSEHRQARKIITECLETGLEFIDISNLNLRTIPSGLLRPIAQFTKYPIISEMDKIPSVSPPNCEQFFSSFEPFLCLFMTNNRLKTLPAEVFELSNLSVLSVRHNELEQIPGSIGNLTKLRELNVGGNQLSYLPFEVLQLLQKNHTHMRQLAVHPNPFVMPESSIVAEWHCNVASDGVFTQRGQEERKEEGDEAISVPAPLSTEIRPASAGSVPIPILIAKGIVQFFDAEGRPVAVPEPITNSNTSTTSSSSSPYSPTLSSTSPSSSPSSSLFSPSLRDIALRAYNRGPQISHLIDPDTFAGPAIILDLLKHAEKVRDAGGKKCSVCARPFVITRAQWIEWWDCESHGMSAPRHGGDGGGVGVGVGVEEDDYGVLRTLRAEMSRIARGRALKPLPFLREVCCWGCAPGFGSGREFVEEGR